MRAMQYRLWHLLLTAALAAPLWAAARSVARLLLPRGDEVTRLLAGLVAAFALAVAAGGALGMAHEFSYVGYLAAFWLAAAIATLTGRSRPSAPAHDEDWPHPPAWLAGLAIVAATFLAGELGAKLAQPVTAYDSLTYHLHFPVQWLIAKRIFLIDTPFGDPAPGYAPAHGELWYAWLLAAWRGGGFAPTDFKLAGVDALAKVGQAPFLAMALAALVTLARRLAGSKPTIYLPAALFVLAPWVLKETGQPAVDLMMAALFLASLAFAQRYRDEGDGATIALAGAALGLALGVKFAAFSYAPLFAAPPLYFIARRRAWKDFFRWCAPLLVFGAPWPIRNWVVAGNPVFPLHVGLGGRTIFPGAYAHAAMLHSVFHVPNLPAAAAVTASAVGFWLTPIAAAGAAAGLVAARRQPQWRAYAWIAPVGVVWHYLAVPYSSQDRFLMWAVALALLPLAAWPDRPRWRPALALLAAACVALDLFGAGFAFQLGVLPVPSYGLFEPVGWTTGALVLALIGGGYLVGRRDRVRKGAVANAPMPQRLRQVRLAALAAGVIAAAWLARPGAGVFVVTDVDAVRLLPLAGYAQLWQRLAPTTAYAGSNRPFYLAGRDGLGRVRYVNRDGCLDCRLCDYVRAQRRHGPLDLSREKDASDAAAPNYDAWRAALRQAGVQYLFLDHLPHADRPDPRASPDHFIEVAWARSHPDEFTLVTGGVDFEMYVVR